MILIVTYKDDYTADFLIDKLNAQDKYYLRLNTEDIDSWVYEATSDSNFLFSLNGIRHFDGVWYRRLKLPAFSGNAMVQEYLACEYDALFTNLFRSLSASRWMSDPDALARAENKLVQLRCASSLGFSIPKTIITNDKKRVVHFAEEQKSTGIVLKPIYSGRLESENTVQLIYTSEVKQEHLDTLENCNLTPSIFQQKISKEYEIRVTVVGDQVFAACVDSQSNELTRVDWRKERLPFRSCSLPTDIEVKCRRLVHQLGLRFGAIDLVKSNDGEFYFLEINPNGQWAWIEMDTGMAIGQAIIDLLYGQK